MAVFDLKNAVLTIQDGTATTPLKITMKLRDGTITHSETRNISVILDRGTLDTMVEGDEAAMTVSVSARFQYIQGDGTAEPADALKKINDASAWVSTNSDTCAPYAVDLVLTNTPLCTSDKDEVITFPKFTYTSINVDYGAGTLAFDGICLAKEPTITRS